MLTRFWFVFEGHVDFSILNLGYGITGYDRADAEKMLQEQVFPIFGVRSIDTVIEDIDVSKLKEKHVRPSMGNPVVRGVWFPLI
jgi:hypothetical protein